MLAHLKEGKGQFNWESIGLDDLISFERHICVMAGYGGEMNARWRGNWSLKTCRNEKLEKDLVNLFSCKPTKEKGKTP